MKGTTVRKTPALRRHKASDQFIVTLSGRDHYLGRDPAKAQREYDRLTAEWLARGRTPETDEGTRGEALGPTIGELPVPAQVGTWPTA